MRQTYQFERLYGQNVILIPSYEVNTEDLREKYRSWLNNDNEVRIGIGENHTYTPQEILDLFKDYELNEIHYIIFVPDKDRIKPIGDISVVIRGEEVDYSSYAKAGYFKIMLGEERGKGYGFEAASILFSYLFSCLGFEIILSSCYSDNKASKNLHKKLGFEQKASSESEIFFELTKENWERQKDKN
ncbi:MAG: GNAT family protein [Candidatus Aenigmatarchaeota archaeon]